MRSRREPIRQRLTTRSRRSTSSGRMRMRVSRLVCRRHREHHEPAIPGVGRGVGAEADGGPATANFMNSAVFSRIAAVHSSLARRICPGPRKRLTERMHDLFIRRGAQLGRRKRKGQLSKINQELAVAVRVLPSEAAGRRRDMDSAGERGPTLRGSRRRWLTARRPQAAERSSRPGGIVNTRLQRRSVSDLLEPARSARARLEEVQEPR
jgi:hypothetical protein